MRRTEEKSIGFVYLMVCELTKTFKVGWSRDPQRRLAGLAEGNPELELLAFFTGNRRAEAAFHRRFKRLRIDRFGYREWFRYGNRAKVLEWVTTFMVAACVSRALGGKVWMQESIRSPFDKFWDYAMAKFKKEGQFVAFAG